MEVTKSILLADERPLCDLVERVLASQGHRVHSFSDIFAALDNHQQEPAQLVFLDWALTGVHAAELCCQLRAERCADEVFVLALVEDEEVQDVVMAGATDFLVKPVSESELASRIQLLEGEVKRSRVNKRLYARAMHMERLATLGQLAATVTHEVNNPLTCLIYDIRSVRSAIPELAAHMPQMALDQFEARVESAYESTERIRLLVADLAKLSSVQDERTELVDVRQVVEYALRVTAAATKQRATVTSDLSEAPLVHANPLRLGQVLVNLLLNSAQAMPGGDPAHEEIRVETDVDITGCAVVTVRDSGVGIAPADMPRIFDPFFTTKAPEIGTGLGLSISRSIVESLGGRLTVESKPRVETTVRIRLPAADYRFLERQATAATR